MLQTARTPDFAISPIFLERWSSRAFTGEAISDEELFALFEAARWAPSASNRQPWRFIYAKRDAARWPDFLSLLNQGNQVWAQNAAALVFVISHSLAERDGKIVPSRTHSLDAGAAWFSLALQASLSGWATRAMGGIDRDAVRRVLAVPEAYTVEIGIAIGRRGEADLLPDEYRGREAPTVRLPLSAIAAEGAFVWRGAIAAG
jgi:nitroreductase